MGSLRDYWDFFWLVEQSALRGQLDMLIHPSWLGLTYVWIILFFCAWETLRPWRTSQPRLRPGFTLDASYTVFYFVIFWAFIGTALMEISGLVFADALRAVFGIEHMVAIRLNQLPSWLRYLLLLLALDFTSYFGHFLMHRVDFLWQFHKVHHSALELDVLNAARLHWVERLVYPALFYLPSSLIGFEVRDAFAVGLFISFFSNFTHANVKIPLGPLKYVLNNPQIHLWHHWIEVDPNRNVNYGDALILWDYLFETAYLPDERGELELGFEGVQNYPTTFWGQLIEPFRAILGRPSRDAAA